MPCTTHALAWTRHLTPKPLCYYCTPQVLRFPCTSAPSCRLSTEGALQACKKTLTWGLPARAGCLRIDYVRLLESIQDMSFIRPWGSWRFQLQQERLRNQANGRTIEYVLSGEAWVGFRGFLRYSWEEGCCNSPWKQGSRHDLLSGDSTWNA